MPGPALGLGSRVTRVVPLAGSPLTPPGFVLLELSSYTRPSPEAYSIPLMAFLHSFFVLFHKIFTSLKITFFGCLLYILLF